MKSIILLLILSLSISISYSQLASQNNGTTRSNRGNLFVSVSPGYSMQLGNNVTDTAQFSGNGGGMSMQAGYYFGKIGLGVNSGFLRSQPDQGAINNFISQSGAPLDNFQVSSTPLQKTFLLVGPMIRWGSRLRADLYAKGGIFFNNSSYILIQQKGASRAAYRNEPSSKNTFGGFNAGAAFSYALNSNFSIGISSDYLSTKNQVVNYDQRRDQGLTPLTLTNKSSELFSAISLRYSISSPRDAASGLPTGKRVLPTVNKRESSSGLATGKRQHTPITKSQTNNDDCTCEDELMDIVQLQPYVIEIEFQDIETANRFLKNTSIGELNRKSKMSNSQSNPLYNDKPGGGENPLYEGKRETGSGQSSGRRQYEPLQVLFDQDNNTIEYANAIYYEIQSPRDAASGLPTGKRMSSITSPRDVASGLPTGKGIANAGGNQGMVMRISNGSQAFAFIPESIDPVEISDMEDGRVTVHVMKSAKQGIQNQNDDRRDNNSSGFLFTGKWEKKDAHIIIRDMRNRTILETDTDGDGGFEFAIKEQGKYLMLINGNPVAHITVIDPDDAPELRAQNNNTVRSNRCDNCFSIIDPIDNDTTPKPDKSLTANYRDVASGQASGKRQHKPVLVIWDTENDIIDYNGKLYARDAGSGMASGKRVLPTVNKREFGISEHGMQNRAIITNNTTRTGSTTLNSQSSSTRFKSRTGNLVVFNDKDGSEQRLTFFNSFTTEGPESAQSILIEADLDGDGTYEPVTNSGNDNQQKAGISTSRSNIRHRSLVIADLDGDGSLDYAAATINTTRSNIKHVRISGPGITEETQNNLIITGDLDGDGLSDNARYINTSRSNIKNRVWGDPHVDQKTVNTTRANIKNIRNLTNNGDGTYSFECNIELEGKDYNATVKARHDVAMNSIRNLK